MAELPRGTVSLMFTDIEGSTQLQRRLGDEYQSVVENHRLLLEEAIGAHGGTVVDRQTESFFAVFSRTRDAVRAAVQAQRAIADHVWPEGGEPFFSILAGDSIRPTENQNVAYFDRPKYNREIARISRLTGGARREAWAELDVEMMRDDPPWAPYMTGAVRDFVSRSFGCYVFNPVFGVDFVAACKK